MAYCRFSDADTYVFATTHGNQGGFECCGCSLDPDMAYPFLRTRSEMIAHLEQHEERGHCTGDAIESLKAELADHGETEFRAGDGLC